MQNEYFNVEYFDARFEFCIKRTTSNIQFDI